MINVLYGVLAIAGTLAVVWATQKAVHLTINMLFFIVVVTMMVYGATLSLSENVSGLADRAIPAQYRDNLVVNVMVPQLQQGVDYIHSAITEVSKRAIESKA